MEYVENLLVVTAALAAAVATVSLAATGLLVGAQIHHTHGGTSR